MKKYLLAIALVFFFLVSCITPTIAAIGDVGVGVGVGLGAAATLPQEGSWITDNEVTKIGKNAVRSGNLLDWTLQDYQWASSSAQQYSTSSLVSFWLTIQRIVYALFLFVILVTAFMLIVTRGRSLSAKRFLPRFLLVVLLVTFSFSLVQFLYQIVDIFQGFFLKNPQGNIISSKDLLYIGFDYKNFQGIRVFGASYDESALMSLLLVKLTAFTYYVMAILLIFRKIILWFLIIISPVFPLLLLFYPLRNTAKIWIGEFFRWLLYAPLFAIFLSGLVKLWQSPFGLPLLFNFKGAGLNETYPTAVNILIGGPGQKVFLHNSVNLPDTFALYLVALLMLWVIIILPFILLQIFLDNLMAFNYKDNPLIKQAYTLMNNRAGLPPKLPIVPVGPQAPAGLARSVPFGRKFDMPAAANLAKTIPITAGQQKEVPRSISQSMNKQAVVMNLTNLSIPTMRDVARFERATLSKDTRLAQEISRTKQTLIQVANPASNSSSVERDRYRQIREKLVTQVREGNMVASTVLNAASTYNNFSNQNSTISTNNSLTNLIKNIASPAIAASKRDTEKISQIKEQLTKEVAAGNQFAQTILNTVNTYSTNQVTQIQQLLQSIANPEAVSDVKKREVYTSLREKITQAEKSGNQLAGLLSKSLEKSTSQEQVKSIQNQLLEAAARGEPLATEILSKSNSTSSTSEKDMVHLQTVLESAAKGGDPLATTLLQMLTSERKSEQEAPVDAKSKLKTGTFPVVNRIQQVSLDDYEAVKKMWKENYKDLSVPESMGQITRKQWVTGEVADIQETISLLSSANPQDIEEGMKHVSDILPFLLIGGFSQTEIIAYLKAKMEAGKSILEEGVINEEEDMLLNAKKSADKALGHLSATVEATTENTDSENAAQSTASVSQTNTRDYADTARATKSEQIITTNAQESLSETQKKSKPHGENIDYHQETLLNQLGVPAPTLREIVAYETGLRSGYDLASNQQIGVALQTLVVSNQLQSSQEKARSEKIRKTLQAQVSEGNKLAQMILSEYENSQITSSKPDDPNEFIRTMQVILDPSAVTSTTEQALYRQAREVLMQEREKEDGAAVILMKLVDKISQQETESVTRLLTRIDNPLTLIEDQQREVYTALKSQLEKEKATSTLANSIISASSTTITPVSANKIRVQLFEAAMQHDSLALQILREYISVPQTTLREVTTFYQQLLTKSGNDPFVTLLLELLKTRTNKSATRFSPSGVRLPKQNRVQPVSIEDYEAIKRMLYDMYLHSNVPLTTDGKDQTRQEWIISEKKITEQALSLLSSDDQANNEEGLELVKDVLPFLLLGGFSQSEVIEYLKAKIAAATDALQTLAESNQPEIEKNMAKLEPNAQVMTKTQDDDILNE